MANWAESLDLALAQPDDSAKETGVWSELEKSLDFNQLKPQASPDVISTCLEDHTGVHYILKNQVEKTYLRLSENQFRIWELMDGEHSVQELIVENFMATGNFAHNMVARLVADLQGGQMLAERGVRSWTMVREQVEKRSLLYRLSAPARFILTQKLAINGLDRIIDWLYRAVGWIFFTRPMQLLFIALSVAGLFAFGQVIQNPANQFIGENYVRGIALVWLASILPVLIHELGHALTVKHYGREVPRGGLMLFFGMPAAFVETTDIWMEPRRARLAVTWNGPYTGLILAGALSLVVHYFPEFSLNNFLFKMIGFAYLTVFMNVNPLLKYDGYYLLSDALEIPSLRERSLAFVRGKFLKRLIERRKFTRDEWIQTVYGVLSLVWTAYALYFMSYFWRTRIREGVEVLFGSGYSLVARFFSLLLVVGIGSFLVLLALGLMRLLQTLVQRFVRDGGLTRHPRLAVILGLLAGALGFGLARLPEGLTWSISAAAGLAAGAFLWRFSAPYGGSLRGTALQLIAAGAIIAGFGEAVEAIPAVTLPADLAALAAAAVLVLAGLLLVAGTLPALGAVPLLGGLGAGVGVFFGLGFLETGVLAQAAGGLLAVMGVWGAVSLRGGARAPGWILLVVGGLWTLAYADVIGVLLICAGALHWMAAQLPELSEDPGNASAEVSQDAVARSAATIVRRVIAQVFFETGFKGVDRLASAFSRAMQENGLNLRIEGNRFVDEEFNRRTVVELTDVYSLAFEELHGLLCGDLGEQTGSRAFNHGVDRLPWQNREVMVELIFSRSDWSADFSDQQEETRQNLITFLKRVPLFVTRPDEDLARIAEALQTEHIAQDTVIMREGDIGDKFYIVERGHVSFWQKDESGTDQLAQEKGPGQFFGEVALVSDQPRNATVIAETPMTVLTLSQADFNALVREYVTLEADSDPRVYRSWLLRSMPIFDELESHELEWLALNMEREQFAQGEVIFREGDLGDRFYIIESGEVIVSVRQNGTEKELARSTTGAYFGEIALLHDIPRTATITTASETVLWSLSREDYFDLVSSYDTAREYLDKTSSRRLSFIED